MEPSKSLSIRDIRDSIIRLRDQNIIIDSVVADLYGVQTKEINQAVKNNPRKFPDGYVFELERDEVENLRSKNLTTISSI